MKLLQYILILVFAFSHCIVVAQSSIDKDINSNQSLSLSEETFPLFPMPVYDVLYDTIEVELYFNGRKINLDKRFEILLCFADTTLFAEKSDSAFIYPTELINKDNGKIIFRYKKTVCALIPFGCNPSKVRNFKNIRIIHYTDKECGRHVSDSCFKYVSELHILEEDELHQEFIVIIHGGTLVHFHKNQCEYFRKFFKSEYKKL